MKKFCLMVAASAFALTFTSAAFAMGMDDSSACKAVVKACKEAGYQREAEEKKFWKDCMEPLLLGETVKKVTIDADKVKECRANKIDEMQAEVKKLQDVK